MSSLSADKPYPRELRQEFGGKGEPFRVSIMHNNTHVCEAAPSIMMLLDAWFCVLACFVLWKPEEAATLEGTTGTICMTKKEKC